MASNWGNNMLPFMAVGRVKDGVTLAAYRNPDADPEEKTMEIFKKLLAAASSKLSASQRTRLQWKDGSVCCLMDSTGQYLYCVVTSLLTYPERLANQLLYDLVTEASAEPLLATAGEQELQQKLEPQMKKLVLYYEDAKNFPQFALGAGVSRESFTSAPSTGQDDQPPAGGNRMKIIVALLVLVIIAVVVWYFFLGGSGATSNTFAAALMAEDSPSAPGGFLAEISKTVKGARTGVVTIA